MLQGGVAGAVAVVLALTLATAAAPQPASLTVHASGTATRTSLHLQAGYATVIRADRQIDTVAIGDPRIVTATPVKRGRDVYDVILQPQVATGATNMVMWLGTLATIWDLKIGAGLRTADVVYVVTGATPAAVATGTGAAAERQARTSVPSQTAAAPRDAQGTGTSAGAPAAAARDAHEAPPPAATAPSQPPEGAPPAVDSVTPASRTIPAPAGAAGPETAARSKPPGPAGPGAGAAPTSAAHPQDTDEAPRSGVLVSAADHPANSGALLARQVIRDVEGRFQVTRESDGIWVRYRLTNNGDGDLALRPTGVLVRANGRVVPYALARNDADPAHPGLLPRGATETGMLEIPGRAIRTVQLILSLFPVSAGDQPPTAILPVTFQPSFVEVDRLPVAAAP